MANVTYENAELFYNETFYGKTSGDTTRIIGKAITRGGEGVLLLANRRFVTIKGFNAQYMPNSEYREMCKMYDAVNSKYMREIKKASQTVQGDQLTEGVIFKAGDAYYYIETRRAPAYIKIRIIPGTYSKKVEYEWRNGIAQHITFDTAAQKAKTLRFKDFKKIIGPYKNEKDFANKFFKEFGFLGFI